MGGRPQIGDLDVSWAGLRRGGHLRVPRGEDLGELWLRGWACLYWGGTGTERAHLCLAGFRGGLQLNSGFVGIFGDLRVPWERCAGVLGRRVWGGFVMGHCIMHHYL